MRRCVPRLQRTMRYEAAAGSAAESWSPLDLGEDLVLWLRADLGNTAASNGVWLDQSGNGRHTAQADAGKRPTLVADWKNGKPALEFDGVDDVLAGAGAGMLADGAAYTLFIVGSKDNDPDTVDWNDPLFRIVGSPFHKHLVMITGGIRYVVGTNAVDVRLAGATTYDCGTDPFYAGWTEQGNTGADAPTFRINGVDKTTVTQTNDLAGVTGYQVGGTSVQQMDGKIAEVILIEGVADSERIQLIEDYLIGFWGSF